MFCKQKGVRTVCEKFDHVFCHNQNKLCIHVHVRVLLIKVHVVAPKIPCSQCAIAIDTWAFVLLFKQPSFDVFLARVNLSEWLWPWEDDSNLSDCVWSCQPLSDLHPLGFNVCTPQEAGWYRSWAWTIWSQLLFDTYQSFPLYLDNCWKLLCLLQLEYLDRRWQAKLQCWKPIHRLLWKWSHVYCFHSADFHVFSWDYILHCSILLPLLHGLFFTCGLNMANMHACCCFSRT